MNDKKIDLSGPHSRALRQIHSSIASHIINAGLSRDGLRALPSPPPNAHFSDFYFLKEVKFSYG